MMAGNGTAHSWLRLSEVARRIGLHMGRKIFTFVESAFRTVAFRAAFLFERWCAAYRVLVDST